MIGFVEELMARNEESIARALWQVILQLFTK